jgi:hypothetical protein
VSFDPCRTPNKDLHTRGAEDHEKNRPGKTGTAREERELEGRADDSVTAAAAATAAIAATTTTAIAATAAGATTAAATATGAGLSLVDADAATHPLDVLKIIDGLGFVGVVGHFNEGEAPFAAGVAIKGKGALAQFAVLGKQIFDVFHFGVEGKISDVNGHEPEKNYEPILRQPF